MLFHISTQLTRDSVLNDSQQIRADLAGAWVRDDAQEHKFSMLPNLYFPHLINYDDSLGWKATASLFAAHVPLSSPVSSYLDFGTGTGLTAMATAKSLINAGYDFRLFLVDGLHAFLDQARNKFEVEFPGRSWSGHDLVCIHSDMFTSMEGLQSHLLDKYGLDGISVITAQRVLLNLRKDPRAEQLRRWARLLSPGGKLIVDIPHPRRRIAAFKISTSPPTCRVIVDTAVWDRCRSYARSLAQDAGLRIVNDMPPHLPTSNQENGWPDFMSWVEACKATSLPLVLGEDEMDWFGLRYATESIPSYANQGFACDVEIAAVIAVFERDDIAEIPTSGSAPMVGMAHTKYEIDESLKGVARKNAIKKARKEAKKAEEAKGKEHEDDRGARASGAVV